MAQTLRFCSWNIQIGKKRAEILRLIAAHPDFRGLDLIALQEASAQAQGDDAASIAQALGKTYASYQHVYHFVGARPQANALVWNTATIEVDVIDHHTLPHLGQVHISRVERLLLNHVWRQPRVNLIGEARWNDLTLRVCSAHLDVLGYRFKQQQFRAVLQALRARPAVDVLLLAGDFNTFRIGKRPTWAELKRDAAAAGLDAISDEILWTHAVRELRFRQKLDEIFLGAERSYHSRVWTLDVNGSDHLPVFAEIVIE